MQFPILKILSFIIAISFIVAEEDVDKVSESLGYMIGKDVKEMKVKFNLKSLFKGIKNGMSDKKSPLSEEECISAICKMQDKVSKEISLKNLKESEAFLDKNKNAKDIISLEGGKVQYRVVKQGKGPEVRSFNSPLVKFSTSFVDGTILQPQIQEVLSLDESLGLAKAVVGMKEGEIRQIFVHPDLNFKDFRNKLLIFEIEVVKIEQLEPSSEIAKKMR